MVSETCGVGAPTVESFTVPVVGEAPVRVERRPFAQVRRIGDRFPDFARRMTQVADENQRPLLPFLVNPRARGGARLITLTRAHFFFLLRRGGCTHAIEMTLERVDVRRPVAAERREPRIDLHERLGPDPVKTSLCIHARLHEAGLAQHAQVFGDRGLRQLQLLLDIAHGLLRRRRAGSGSRGGSVRQ